MTLPFMVPRHLALGLAVRADNLEGTAQIGRFLAGGEDCELRALGQRMQFEVLLAQGRFRAAGEPLGSVEECDPALAVELRVLAATHPFLSPQHSDLGDLQRILEGRPDSGSGDEDELLALGMDPKLQLYYRGLIALQAGDTLAAFRLGRRLSASEGVPGAGQAARTLTRSLRARIALARGRPRPALALLEGARWEQVAGLSPEEVADRYLRAELLRQAGRSEEAIGWFRSIAERAPYELVYLAPAELRLAQIYDYRGDWPGALDHYRRFVDLWRGSDPELRPQVAEAQARIAELERGRGS
jgi:tetratricopeptide (TPR) repeat protein